MAPVTRSHSLRDDQRKRRNEEGDMDYDGRGKNTRKNGDASGIKSDTDRPCSGNVPGVPRVLVSETEKEKPAVFFSRIRLATEFL